MNASVRPELSRASVRIGVDALDQQTPALRYTTSPRPYPARPQLPEYPGHFVVKTIATAGTFRFGKRIVPLANALTNQRIDMEQTEDGRCQIYFHAVLLVTFDERDYIIQS